MRFNPKVKLRPGQVQDFRRDAGGQRRASMDPEAGTRPISPEQAAAENDYYRYHHITYIDAARPVGHNRGATIKMSRPGRKRNLKIDVIPDPPDSADRTKPPKKVKIRKGMNKTRRMGPRPPRG